MMVASTYNARRQDDVASLYYIAAPAPSSSFIVRHYTHYTRTRSKMVERKLPFDTYRRSVYTHTLIELFSGVPRATASSEPCLPNHETKNYIHLSIPLKIRASTSQTCLTAPRKRTVIRAAVNACVCEYQLIKSLRWKRGNKKSIFWLLHTSLYT